jgi:hypothetical protein
MATRICIYYDEKKQYILDVTPRELEPELRTRLEEVWASAIQRQILILLSEGVNRLPDIQERIGHSPSTLHAAVQRLVDAGFIQAEMIYKGNKQKILASNVICVTRNPSSKVALQKFFQGLWVDSEKTNHIIGIMNAEPDRWWSMEELSVASHIPIDEIQILLSNFDSITTRAFSQFLKDAPFEKKVMYRASGPAEK